MRVFRASTIPSGEGVGALCSLAPCSKPSLSSYFKLTQQPGSSFAKTQLSLKHSDVSELTL